jgi:hypothetical protein
VHLLKVLGIPGIVCMRFERKPGNCGIRRIPDILTFNNLSVSADDGFDPAASAITKLLVIIGLAVSDGKIRAKLYNH